MTVAVLQERDLLFCHISNKKLGNPIKISESV